MRDEHTIHIDHDCLASHSSTLICFSEGMRGPLQGRLLRVGFWETTFEWQPFAIRSQESRLR
jgi:hypothetical protein